MSTRQEEQFFSLVKDHDQHHLLEHYKNLKSEKQKEFLQGLQGLDLGLVFRLHKKFVAEDNAPPTLYNIIKPAPIITIPKTPEEKTRREEARILGESLIRENQVAILIVAGGQSTRLGYNGPKGTFPISPIKKKSLFRLFAETVKALSIRHSATIPLLIMTSSENHRDTQQFFLSNQFFGLDPGSICFFEQGVLPTITPEGKLILKDDTHLLANPDGHGGSLKGLYESGLLKYLTENGFSELFYCQVDNPLVKTADPVFIGYHRMEKAEISTKVVRRRDFEEKVGIYGIVNGKPAIIEYSDLLPDNQYALDEKGDMRYWAGNIAVHMISLSFVQRLNQDGYGLPYHRAVKTIETLGPDGKPAKMIGWKFETFVFDAIPLAQNTCCVEVIREEEFAPVKNSEGVDSPDTARTAMNMLYRTWLKEAGAELAPEAQIEISPLYALDKEELTKKFKGQAIYIGEDTFLGVS